MNNSVIAKEIMKNLHRTVLAGAVALGLVACMPNVSLEERLKTAESYVQNNERSAAIIELKNAISDYPDSAETRFMLGKIYLSSGNGLSAEKELSRAFDINSDLAGLNEALARTYYLLSDLDKLRDHVKHIESTQGEGLLPSLVYSALLEMANENFAEAERLVAAANDISEEALYSRLGSAWLLSASDWNAALSSTEQLIKENPQFSDALLLQAHIISAQGQIEKAAAIYKTYLDQHPASDYVRLFYARNLLLAEKYEEARAPIMELVRLFGSNSLVNQMAAHLEFRVKNFTQAKIYADKAIAANSKDTIAMVISGVSAYQMGKMEQAYQALVPAENLIPRNHPAHKILSMVRMNLGYLEEAVNSLSSFDEVNIQDAGMLKYAVGQFARLGDVTSAQMMLEKARALEPENPQLKSQEGILKIFNGDSAGISDLESALNDDPTMANANVALIYQLMLSGNESEALEKINAWKAADPKSDLAFLLEGVVLNTAQKHEEAEEAFRKAHSLNDKNASVLTFLGFYAAKNEKLADAQSYYQQAISIFPQSKSILGLTYVNQKLSQQSETLSFLEAQLKEKPASTQLTMSIALEYLKQGKAKEAQKVLEGFDNTYANHPHISVMLGDVYTQTQQVDKAIQRFESAAELYPQSPMIALRLMGVYNQARRYADGLALANKTLELYPGNIQTLLLKSNFLLTMNKVEEAEKTFNLIDDNIAKDEFYHQVKGNIAMLSKRFDDAVDAYYELYRLNTNNKNANNLTKALMLAGKTEEALKTIESHVARTPEDASLQMLLADYYKDAKLFDKASGVYKALLELKPDNFVVLNNLAWNEMQQGNVEQAFVYADKALSLAPSNWVVVDTYSNLLIDNNRAQEAVLLIENLLKNSQNSNKPFDLMLTYAKALNLNGQAKQASNVLDGIAPANAAQKNAVDEARSSL